LNSDAYISSNVGVYPAILKGREGRMNGQIIRYLALNGPSLIYSVAKDLGSRSQTKVHYPTVNRRMHELVRRQYVEKAGTRITKAGIPADLYTTRTRGDFAALAGILDSSGKYTSEMSPKEIRQMIASASSREGSPFVLLLHILEEGQAGIDLVDRELVPEIIKGVRSGYLNLDAVDEEVICSSFSSLIARKITSLMNPSGGHQSTRSVGVYRAHVDILMRSIEKTIAPSHHLVANAKASHKDNVGLTSRLRKQESQLTPISGRWGSELKVFLRLHSVRFE